MKAIATHLRKLTTGIALTLLLSPPAIAQDYVIDTPGMHASIQFRIKHLGFSWLTGRFEKFSGNFHYDRKQPENSSIQLTVQTASIDTNHAERDKHLREKKYLGVKTYPEATFSSTSFTKLDEDIFKLEGTLNLHGVSRPVSMQVHHIGEGRDPWGKFRRGFEARFEITLADYGITGFLGKEARSMELIINLEGVRQ